MSESALLTSALQATTLAIAPVSEFAVGAALRGASGEVHLGYNIELPFLGLNGTLHAEQVAMLTAITAGEKGVEKLAVTAAPCGHCRQFLYEFCTADFPIVIQEKGMRTLADLFPLPFGPEDLGVDSFWERRPLELEDFAAGGPGERLAIEQLRHSYSPYSGVPTGLAVETKDGRWFGAFGIESAAFNPSTTSFHSVLIQLFEHGLGLQHVSQAVLAVGYFADEAEVLELYRGHWMFLSQRCFPQVALKVIPVLCHE